MLGFGLVAVVAFGVTALVTPKIGRLALAAGAVDRPMAPRTHHAGPVPTLGGLGIVAGVVAAMGVAGSLPGFAPLFDHSSEPAGVLVGVVLITLVGVADDLVGLAPSTKLAGQIVAALAPVLMGFQLVYAWVPGFEVVTLSADLGVPLTVLAIVAMVNAVNLVDGLDGLAAGTVAIGAAAFFGFVVATSPSGINEAVPTSAPLVAAIVVGVSLGFLVHNVHPARVFMGDTGAMVLGLLLASACVAYVGRTTAPSSADLAGAIPLLVPVLVLAIPLLDVAFAVVRRTWRRAPLTRADHGHLHHLLLAFGHTHRRAVAVLWYWSAVLAGVAVAAPLAPRATLVGLTSLAVAVGVLLTASGTPAGGAVREPRELDADARSQHPPQVGGQGRLG